jgi:hypothetical protein
VRKGGCLKGCVIYISSGGDEGGFFFMRNPKLAPKLVSISQLSPKYVS